MQDFSPQYIGLSILDYPFSHVDKGFDSISSLQSLDGFLISLLGLYEKFPFHEFAFLDDLGRLVFLSERYQFLWDVEIDAVRIHLNRVPRRHFFPSHPSGVLNILEVSREKSLTLQIGQKAHH